MKVYAQKYLNSSHFYSIDGHLIQLRLDSILQFKLYSDNDTILYTSGNSRIKNRSELLFSNFTNHFDNSKTIDQLDHSNPIVNYLMLNPKIQDCKHRALQSFKIKNGYLIPACFNEYKPKSVSWNGDSASFFFNTAIFSFQFNLYSTHQFILQINTYTDQYTISGKYTIKDGIILLTCSAKDKNLLRLVSIDQELIIQDNLLIGKTSFQGIKEFSSNYIYLYRLR